MGQVEFDSATEDRLFVLISGIGHRSLLGAGVLRLEQQGFRQGVCASTKPYGYLAWDFFARDSFCAAATEATGLAFVPGLLSFPAGLT